MIFTVPIVVSIESMLKMEMLNIFILYKVTRLTEINMNYYTHVCVLS